MAAPLRLTEGLHPGVPEDAYHADPCHEPSLSASVAKLLISASPMHAWHAHPRLNREWEPSTSTSRQDVGTAAHALLLGVGKGMVEVDAENWRTNAAKDARAKARAAGMVPVLATKAKAVRKMVEAARNQLAAPRIVEQIGEAFADGAPEQTMIWRADGTLCRSRIDYGPKGGGGKRVVLIDYKTTEGSAEPEAFGRHMDNMQYPLQAAFYEHGWRTLFPDTREFLFAFVAQETDAPYATSVVALSNPWRGMAREDVDEAIEIWRRCLKANYWPGYPREVCMLDAPSWTGKQREERKLLGMTPLSLLKRAMEWQAPIDTKGKAA